MMETNIDGKAIDEAKKMRIGRTPRIFFVTAVAVAVIVLVYYLLLALEPSAPYPSDETPLSAYSGGVIWNYDSSLFSGMGHYDDPFSNLSFFIAYPGDWGQSFEESSGYGSGLFNDSRAIFADYRSFEYGDPGSFITSGKDTAQGIVWSTFWILITDPDSNGRWTSGDSISVFSCLTLDDGSLVQNGYVNDTDYAIAIRFQPEDPRAGLIEEFHFAFHKDKFYSWIPERMLCPFSWP